MNLIELQRKIFLFTVELKIVKTKHTKPSDKKLEKQGSRCMVNSVPFCHSGCPLGNMILILMTQYTEEVEGKL